MFGKFDFRLSHHLLILFCAVFIGIFANFKFYSIILPNAYAEMNYLVLFTSVFVHILLIALILNILCFRFYAKPFLILILLISAISGYFMDSFATVIDKDMLQNVINTDTQEAGELFTLKLCFYLLFLCILPSIFIYKTTITKQSFIKELGFKSAIIVCLGLFLGSTWLIVGKNYSPFFRNHDKVKYYTNPSYPISSAYKYLKMTMEANKEFKTIAEDAATKQTRKLFVLVVGETARAQNFWLNGYEKQTNEFTGGFENLVSFSDFSSCGTSTAISVPCMFSQKTKSSYTNEDRKFRENLIDVMEKVGVDTHWIGNNSGGCQEVCKRMKQNNILEFNGSDFDEIMLNELKRVVKNDTASSKFIVIHLQGSHGPTYYKRYPKEFEKFTPACPNAQIEKCDKKELENTYDNTIYYSDYIVSSVIDEVKALKEYDSFVWYVSDHGESLGENGLYLHGLPYAIAPETQTKVPSIMWAKSGEEFKKFAKNKDIKLSHDFIFHTVLGAMEIETNIYNEALDIAKI